MSSSDKGPEGSRGPTRLLRVLVVEDSAPDAILLMRALERGGFKPEYLRVDTRQALENALAGKPWDLILADHAMPQFSAPEALEMVKAYGLDVPFIIVSGHIEEETAVAAMRAGAHDYIMKDRLARFAPAVERELREAEVRRARKKSEQELRRAHEELEMRVAQRTADLQIANQKLQKVIEERRRLENELLEIAENERRRIGFDLHDELGQMLTGMSLMIKGIEQRLTAEHHSCADDAHKVQVLATQITNHAHDLAHQFSSLDVRGDDLSVVLKGLAGNVHKMFQIPCVFTVKGGVPDLPHDTTLQLYKIVQEAVSNAIKHGKASQVSISLTNDHHELALAVKNDGLPFTEPAHAKDRMGLRIMNYRANTIGAHLEVKPLRKSGTIVSCVLPLRKGASLPEPRHQPVLQTAAAGS